MVWSRSHKEDLPEFLIAKYLHFISGYNLACKDSTRNVIIIFLDQFGKSLVQPFLT